MPETAARPMPINKSEERIRRMFGEISPRYDLLNHLLSGGIDIYWRWRTVRMVPAEGDAPILDVCTGTGDLALAYWNRSNAPVVATDFTHEMLQLARAKWERRRKGGRGSAPESASAALRTGRGRAPLTFLEADTQRLPFADGCFQIVCVAFGLRNVTDTLLGLKEMARVCRPGGRVVVLEFSMPGSRLFGAVYRWYFRNVLPRIGQLISGSRQAAYNYLPQSVAEFPNGAELAALMEQASLRDVRWQGLTFGVATLYWGVKPQPR